MIKKFNVGVKGIIKTDQGYLILKHAKGHFDTPGGRIDDNEDFKDTLQRELGEELPGITNIEIGDLIGAFRLQKDIDGDISLVLLYFLVNATLPDPIALSEEHTEHLFIKNLAGIPDGLNPEIEGVLRKIL
ncbi:NUDIX hydrolase [bacterium]|nr:NUDIX hydrolase [bacterium]